MTDSCISHSGWMDARILGQSHIIGDFRLHVRLELIGPP